MNQHVESKCPLVRGRPCEQCYPSRKSVSTRLPCMQIQCGSRMASVVSNGRKRTAVQQGFFVYVQRQLHPMALFMCTTMRIIYSLMYSSNKEISQHFSQDNHKQRHYSFPRLFFFCSFLSCFCKITRLP